MSTFHLNSGRYVSIDTWRVEEGIALNAVSTRHSASNGLHGIQGVEVIVMAARTENCSAIYKSSPEVETAPHSLPLSSPPIASFLPSFHQPVNPSISLTISDDSK
ncbi:hypothetical protein OIU74_007373 [Salix koriyanagi]|uniref:Uncharacterized protein n=1 Tax=Salix koriyanagi TaxID=2511006 RepID=A0A9Q0U3M1_9ROSI|nr:hypothetical protein OIU74_007373 [Salix koriyanagi]